MQSEQQDAGVWGLGQAKTPHDDLAAPAQELDLGELLSQSLAIEVECVMSLSRCLPDIERAISLLRSHEQKVVFSGVGKSGALANRISSSFASVGIDCRYVHAYEAAHGELGILREGDILIPISHSGETAEVVELL